MTLEISCDQNNNVAYGGWWGFIPLPLYRATERGTDNEEMDGIIATLTTTHLAHCTAINEISIKISQ